MLIHPFEPVYDSNSRILILGTFPSVKSRENDFYYGHPQNRFWKVLAAVFEEAGVPSTIEAKKAFLLRNGIALWDVIASCDISGSADASIANVTSNDIAGLLLKAPVTRIYCNGAKAWDLYGKYAEPLTGRTAEKLPSTSPANAAWSLDRLTAEWKRVLSG